MAFNALILFIKKKIMRFVVLFFFGLTFLSCAKNAQLTGDQIMQKAIEAQGGKVLDQATISFDFRKEHFTATRNNGKFSLEKCSDLKCQDTVDVLTNAAFKRTIQGEPVRLPDSLQAGYGSSVNSVHYFAVLPYGLDNASVIKKLVDTVTINAKPYYKIKVDFKKAGGGSDYEDEYMYWINRKTFFVDFLAYNYQVNEGGTRFREAYNPRVVNGVRIVDYRNFAPREQYPPLGSLDSLFKARKLDLFSVIELKHVQVEPCADCN